MQIELSAADKAFRAEARDFIEARLPPDIRRRVEGGLALVRDDYVAWHRILHERGWWRPRGPANTEAPAGRRSSVISSTPRSPPPARRASCPSESRW